MNSIQKEGRYQKDRKLKETMLKILMKHEKDGIAPEDFISQIRSKMKVSRGKIFKTIKEFSDFEPKRIRIELDQKDRRRVRYYPNIASVKAEISRFQIEDYLKTLKNPQVFEYSKIVGDYRLSVSFLFQHAKKVKLDQKLTQELIPALMGMLEPFMKETKLEAFAVFIGCNVNV